MIDQKLPNITIDKDVLKLFGVAPLAYKRTQRQFNINSDHLESLIMFYHLQRSKPPKYAVDHEMVMNFSDGDPNYEMIHELKKRGWIDVYGVVGGKKFYKITDMGIRISRFFLRNLDSLFRDLQ